MHNTGCNTWLVLIHPRVNLVVFGNNRADRTTDTGKYVPKTNFFDSSQKYSFLRKQLKQYSVPPSLQKRLYSLLLSDAPSLRNGHAFPKNYFSQLFWKILFFFFFSKKLLNEKCSKSQCLPKRLY